MSTMMVTSELNLGHSMANIEVESKRGQMKIFLKSVKEYMKTKSEQLGMQINRLLQVLSVTIDLSIFDPNNSTVSEFLVCLHELMMGIEQRSSIAWNCVEVLCNVCKNSAARTAIIHTYQFLGPLSRLLGDHLPYERKLKLLKLLQDVTCGIKISWLVPQLPPLMFMLTKWIDTERGDEQLVNVCLGIIVNICYKNLPGVYTLSRYVDLKKLMKTCMNLRGPKVEVHICKLLIILDYNSGNVPEEALLKLIEVTFKNIIEAFKAFDAVLLRHIVEFFLDVLKENQNSEIMASYAHYYSQVQNLLEVLESNFGASEGGDAASRDPECMALIFQFLLAIIQIKFFELHAFYSRILHLVLQWLQTDVTCAPALLVLQTIVVNSVKHEIVNLSPIGPSIPMLLTTFNLGTEGILADIEQQKIMGALLQLLRALLEANYLRERLLIDIRVEMVEKMFVPFLTETNKAMDEEEAGCSVDAINLFVYSVALVEELQKHDEQWKKLYAELMDQKQVHILLAQALYRCPKDVKRTILKMTTSPTFPLDAVTDALTELQHIMDDPSAKNEKQMARSNVYIPVISVAKIEMVDSVISELKQAISENNLISVSTSHVMELYEYKIAAMSHSERVSMASIEAASQRCMHLQHRVAQLSTELNRLHQLFIGTQQNYEVATKKVEEITESMKDIEEKYTVEREKYKECKSKLQVKEQSVAKLQVLTEELDRKNAELAKEKLAADEQNIAYKKVIVKLEENIQRKEKIDERNKESLKQANAGIEILRKQKAELESKLLTKENELAAALQNLKRTREELEEKRRVMETITRMVSSQKT